MSKRRTSPLPHRDGIAPSFLQLPAGQWPDLLTFLIARFPHMPAEILRGRLERGEIVDHQGEILATDSPFQPNGRIWYYREVPEETPVPFAEHILYQDERLLVADKPHFLACIPAGRYLQETLLTRLRKSQGLADIAPIHRLDRETAGIMLFALEPACRAGYHALFSERNVAKEYEAIAPYRADLELPRVHRSFMQEQQGMFTMEEAPGEPNSETYIEIIEIRGNWARYRLKPHTGKKHQLRTHLSALGIPIVNDPWYPELLPEKGDDFSKPLQLLARAIEFIDPFTGEARRFESPRQLSWPESV